jgi:hypothetical protein
LRGNLDSQFKRAVGKPFYRLPDYPVKRLGGAPCVLFARPWKNPHNRGRRGIGINRAERNPDHAGLDGGQKLKTALARQYEQKVGRRLLKNFQQGILRLRGHPLGARED